MYVGLRREPGLVGTNSYEEFVLARYSTPSLQRNTLTKDGKRNQLETLGIKPDEVKKIMAELYPDDGPAEGQVRS